MDQKLHEEVTIALNELVTIALIPTKELLLEVLEDMFYGEELDTDVIEKEIDKVIAAKLKEEQSWGPVTDFDRLDEVFAELNRYGIVAVHIAGYTSSDGFEEAYEAYESLKEDGIDVNGYCYYTTQDFQYAVKDQFLHLAFGAFVNHEKNGLLIGKIIAKVLEKAGFSIVWDGTLEQKIEIRPFVWQKRFGLEHTVRIPADAFMINNGK